MPGAPMPPRMMYTGGMMPRPPRFNPQPTGPTGAPQTTGPRPSGPAAPQGFASAMPNYVVPANQRSRGPPRRVGPGAPITPGISPNVSAPQPNGAPVVVGAPTSVTSQPNGKPRQPQGQPNQGQRVKFSSTARNQPNQFGQVPANGPAQPIPSAPAPPSLPPLDQLEAMMGPEEAKQVVGEQLFVHISRQQPQLAGKITGMFLDSLDLAELVALLQSRPALDSKVLEALHVLQTANIPVDNSGPAVIVDGQNPSIPLEQPASA